MGIFSWIIFGALAGWVASMVMGRNNQMGCLANIAVGIIGAVVGGWIMSFFGKGGVTGFDLVSFVVAVIGAVVFLGILNLLTGRRR
ncbi:MAG: GlsB/YeaQ/YmgE family stress response membrane protein [Chloroflexi bacterium]|nr:GlsB/YeaQ/YmgE family stress response membrane protein [Chloroflexota bacterium]MBP7044853.1 GlsB/YeaQ/YmgE family stress response membrane protein [Chloroflexota bacterium]